MGGVGGSNLYPSLETVTSLFRSMINDDGAGQNGITGGQIATDSASFMLPFLNGAIRDLFSDLRMIDDQTLILDNYLLLGLPAINAAVNPPNPAIQCYLSSLGYFDGYQLLSSWILPANCLNVQRVWERPNVASGPNMYGFHPMSEAQFGLPSRLQRDSFGEWEWRQDQINLPGALVARDLRLRCTVQFTPLSGTNLNFSNIYIPILDCDRNIVDKMLVRYSRRFSPDQYQVSVAEESKSLAKLKFEIVYRRQTIEYRRADWGGDDDFLPWASQL